MRNRLLLAGLVAGVLTGAGCHRRWCRDEYTPSGRAPSSSRLDPPVRSSGGGIPPTSIPTTPPSNVPSLPPPEIPDSGRSSFRLGEPILPADAPAPAKPADPTPPAPAKPAETAPPREILLPDPLPGDSNTARKPTATRQWLGEPIRPDDAPPAERTAEKPAEAAGPSRQPAGFVRLAGRDGQATGRVPTGGELDWLAANGFKSVVLLHDPKADVADFRSQAEKRHLRAVTIPVDAADLGAAYEAFARAVADKGGRPVYVADADPARAAAMWYALFRNQEMAGDEVARLRLHGLGAAPETATVWPAVQGLLAKP